MSMQVQLSQQVQLSHESAAGQDLGLGAQCLNCGTAVCGPFCPACGEQHAHNRILPAKELARHLWKEFVSVDARLVRTLKVVLFRPGEATLAYVQGRRRSLIGPLRLYMLLSTIYFLVIAIYQPYGVSPDLFLDRMEKNGFMERFLEKLTEEGLTLELFKERMKTYYNHALSLLYLTLIPASAVLLMLVYRRTGRYFHEHFIFAIHFSVFTLAVSLLLLPLEAVGPMVYGVVPSVITYVYLLLALRKFYGEPWGATSVKFLVVFVCMVVVTLMLMVPAMLVSIRLAMRG